ncbi:MAG: (Fe-S)-binding protein [Acidobacteria bacterium]|nr:(Fe-S)-binding protein [Acidobacteriota bacterium]
MTTAAPVPGQNPTYEDFARCVHCGICLNACPTYRLWNLESDSPRGRIHQMIHVAQTDLAAIGSAHPESPSESGSVASAPSAVNSASAPSNGQGTTGATIAIGPKNKTAARAEITKSFVDHIDKCLDCRACETACPSSVEYGKLVEHARALIERDYKRPLFTRIARYIAFRKLLPSSERIATLARLIWLYQKTGLQRFVRFSGMLELFGLADREQLLPEIEPPFFFKELGRTYPAVGQKRGRVAFFAGCVAQVAFARLNDATIRVLNANGIEVVVPKTQQCCGALAAHAGIRDAARDLARKNLFAFADEEFDAIVTNAAGCGSTLKEYDHLFTEKETEFAQAVAFKSKVRDVTEYLAELGLTTPLRPLKPLYLRVTYQDSCHLLHGQKVRDAPRDLLKQIPGLELVELPHADICCGSAGVYNVTQTKASLELLNDKMKNITSIKPEVIVTANPGCLLQLRAGVQRVKGKQEVMHVVELLDRSMRAKKV